MDLNPKFGSDSSYIRNARKVTDLLWETTKGNFAESPQSYLETLKHEFSDGKVSMLELIDRIDLGPSATYEDYTEVFNALVYSDSSQWPDKDSIVSISSELLLDKADSFEFNEFEYSEQDMSSKMETFLKKVLASVYKDGITDVTDRMGDPPSEGNNYLLSDDGKKFTGVFFGLSDKDGKQPYLFTISDNNGTWQVKY
jgi:hypothetical protein